MPLSQEPALFELAKRQEYVVFEMGVGRRISYDSSHKIILEIRFVKHPVPSRIFDSDSFAYWVFLAKILLCHALGENNACRVFQRCFRIAFQKGNGQYPEE